MSLYDYKINKYFEVKLEEGKTNIYICGHFFRHCKYILVDIERSNISMYSDSSIDDIAEYLGHDLEKKSKSPTRISPEVEFWAHCSNLEVWANNDYNSKFLHRNIAFPMLKELSKAGDPLAIKVFKEEIVKRICSWKYNVVTYLIEEDYLQFLDSKEALFIFDTLSETPIEILAENFNFIVKVLDFLESFHFDRYNEFVFDLCISLIRDFSSIDVFNFILRKHYYKMFPEEIMTLYNSHKFFDLVFEYLSHPSFHN